MTDGRRTALSILNGLILLTAGLFAAWHSTEPTVTVVDTPMLVSNAPVDPTTTAAPPPAAVPVSTEVPRAAAPVAPPRNEYAPEPILEIGVIEIPKIGLRHQVFHGITMRNIDKGPSHWPGTALPGEVGNTVFMGHRVTKTHPFRNIDQLENGDEVFFTINPAAFGAAGEPVRTRYVVTGEEVVKPTALSIVDPTPTATGTLFACHPPGSARYRYVVRLAYAPNP